MTNEHPVLTANDKVKLAVQVIPFVLEREKMQLKNHSETLELLDNNDYLAQQALMLVEAIETEARQRQTQTEYDRLPTVHN